MEESAAIARVRVMAMLSTDSVLDDKVSSDDLESEVEHRSYFAKTTPSTAKTVARSFFYSDRHEVGHPRDRVLPNTKQSKSVCCETSRTWPKLSELEISSRANTRESSDVLSALGELTSPVNMVVKRLEKTEHRIQSMDKKMESTSCESDSTRLKVV